jgi:glycosyltransferase involved in cell wall biosynthesis
MMKTVFVTSWLSSAGGGVSAAVSALSAGIQHRGCDVRVLGLADARWDREQLDWQGAPVAACRVAGPRALGFTPDLPRQLHAADPQIAHSHGLWMHTSRNVVRWARTTGRPYLVSPHGMLDPWAVAHSRVKKSIIRRLYEGSHLRGAACLHALCGAEADAIRSYGLRNPICVIPNGISLPANVRPEPAPWAGLLPGDARILLFLGRLHPKKNLATLIDAIGRVDGEVMLGRGCPWRVVITGWDQLGHEQELKEMVARHRLEERFLFTGPLFGKAKDAAFRHACAFVLPSLSEGLPMAVLEAWSYGLPVLMTAACNLPNGFTAGAALQISHQSEPMSLSLATLFSLDDEVLNGMGRCGRHLVETEFSWDRISEEMVAVYEWLLRRTGAPSTVCFMEEDHHV